MPYTQLTQPTYVSLAPVSNTIDTQPHKHADLKKKDNSNILLSQTSDNPPPKARHPSRTIINPLESRFTYVSRTRSLSMHHHQAPAYRILFFCGKRRRPGPRTGAPRVIIPSSFPNLLSLLTGHHPSSGSGLRLPHHTPDDGAAGRQRRQRTAAGADRARRSAVAAARTRPPRRTAAGVAVRTVPAPARMTGGPAARGRSLAGAAVRRRRHYRAASCKAAGRTAAAAGSSTCAAAAGRPVGVRRRAHMAGSRSSGRTGCAEADAVGSEIGRMVCRLGREGRCSAVPVSTTAGTMSAGARRCSLPFVRC